MGVYFVNGDGIHGLKHMLEQGIALPVCMASSVSKALDNSIQNFYQQDAVFHPINLDALVEDYDIYIQQGEDGKSREDLIREFDESLNYHGVRKLTVEECKQLTEYEATLKARTNMRNNIDRNGVQFYGDATLEVPIGDKDAVGVKIKGDVEAIRDEGQIPGNSN